MAKINIPLPHEPLENEAAQAARAERLGRALDKMRSLAPAVGAPDTGKAIRELRNEPSR